MAAGARGCFQRVNSGVLAKRLWFDTLDPIAVLVLVVVAGSRGGGMPNEVVGQAWAGSDPSGVIGRLQSDGEPVAKPGP